MKLKMNKLKEKIHYLEIIKLRFGGTTKSLTKLIEAYKKKENEKRKSN